MTTATAIQDKVLLTVKAAEDGVLAATRSWAERMQPLTKRMPQRPASLPSASESAQRWFSVQEKVLANVKEFSTNFFDALSATAAEPGNVVPATATVASQRARTPRPRS
jgi:hypothetical protein